MARTAYPGLTRLKWTSSFISAALVPLVANVVLLIAPLSASVYASLAFVGSVSLLAAALVLIPGWNLFEDAKIPKNLSQFWRIIIAIGKATYWIGMIVSSIFILISQAWTATPPEPTARLGVGTTALVSLVATVVIFPSQTAGARNTLVAAAGISLLTILILILRVILGWVRLLPASWRRPRP